MLPSRNSQCSLSNAWRQSDIYSSKGRSLLGLCPSYCYSQMDVCVYVCLYGCACVCVCVCVCVLEDSFDQLFQQLFNNEWCRTQ